MGLIPMRSHLGSVAAALIGSVAATGCSGGGQSLTDPNLPAVVIEFSPATIDIGASRTATVEIRNAGEGAVGPIGLAPGSVLDAGGLAVPGSQLEVLPSEIPTLAAGTARELQLTLNLADGIQSGSYRASLEARVGSEVAASLGLDFSVSAPSGPVIGSLQITAGESSPRQGDVVAYSVEALDDAGQPVADPAVTWSIQPTGAGLFSSDGRLVGYIPGPAQIMAAAGQVSDTLDITVTPRGVSPGTFEVIGQGRVSTRYTSDHWEYGDVAFTGTWGCRPTTGGRCGNALFVWDISLPSDPVLTDSVLIDARVVNDVKVRADGTLAIITHESSADGLNGITLLDVTDLRHPQVISRFTAPDLAPGIHNVWIEGDYAYLVVDGAVPSSGLRVVDVSQPSNPRIVADFYGGSSFLHDVYVRDGLAFLSHWWEGLIILDVGNGIAGGSPTIPREVGRIAVSGYRVHNAWYWPDAGYVFLGDEVDLPGSVKVIDVSDLRRPREVASFTLPGAAPHNFWLDEARGIAYFSWYENGIQAVDVSGELSGELERQGRRIAELQYGVGNFCFGGAGTCTWAPQLHNGSIFLSDLNTGLWVLRADF
jgi:hypothetical protein